MVDERFTATVIQYGGLGVFNMERYELCMMNCHYRFYELEEFFRYAQELEIRNAEIWTAPHHFFVNYERSDNPHNLKALAASYGVKIVCICPEQTNPKPNNVAAKDPDQIGRVYQYYRNIIDVAAETGAFKVVITSGWAFYNEPLSEAKERSVAMLKRICSYAEEKGVVLAMEALQKSESLIVNTIADLKEIIDRVESKMLKVCLDFGAMAAAGEAPEDYFEAFGPDLVHCHFVDGKPVGHLAWGDGIRDMKKDLEVFDRYDYQGYLSLESANGLYFKQPYLADGKTKQVYEAVQKEKN